MEDDIMSKYIVLLLLTFSSVYSYTQINNDLIIEQIERMTEGSEDEYNDYSELVETYWSLTENPINVNSDDIDQLAEFKFISIYQLESIKNYRRNYGNFQFVEELSEVEGLDDLSIEMIKPLISFEKNTKYDFKFSDILKYGRNKMLMEVNQCLNKKKGYIDVDDSLLVQKPNSIYLGSPQKLYLRYNYSFRNNIEAGFVMEKDPGEYLFKNDIPDTLRRLIGDKYYKGFDFYSIHIFIKNLSFLEALAIGDYKISFGQGLTMGSGMAFISRGGTLMRRSKKITPSKSANEAYYLRGVAATLKYLNLELSIFYSNKNSDANVLTYDSLSETPIEIRSLQQTGLHRTYNELICRKTINQQLYGLNMSYRISNFQLGYTIHQTRLSAELNPVSNVYNTFNFRGKSLLNQGLDFYYILRKMFLYGEIAMSDNRGLAGLIGFSFQPAGYIDFTILYRNYAKDYQCLYSNAFSSGSNTRNEEGVYFSMAASIAPQWKFITSVDFLKNDWLKNTAYAPSHGCEFDSQLNYQPNNNTLMFIEYRNYDKMKNASDANVYQKYLVHERSNMFRLHVSYTINDYLTLKNRVEYHFKNQENEKYDSYLIYQDVQYKKDDKPYSFAFRYEIFDSEKGSVYTYESDVLYAFAVSGLSGKGIRTYLVGKVELFKHIQISGKIGFTFYDDKNMIGSGLETIEKSWRSDAKLQIIWSF